MIAALVRNAARVGVCAVVVGVWCSGLFGWLGTVAAAPFVAGLCLRAFRNDL